MLWNISRAWVARVMATTIEDRVRDNKIFSRNGQSMLYMRTSDARSYSLVVWKAHATVKVNDMFMSLFT